MIIQKKNIIMLGLWQSPWQPRHVMTTHSPLIATGGNACDVTHSITSIKYKVLYTSAIIVTVAIRAGFWHTFHDSIRFSFTSLRFDSIQYRLFWIYIRYSTCQIFSTNESTKKKTQLMSLGPAGIVGGGSECTALSPPSIPWLRCPWARHRTPNCSPGAAA